MLSVGPIGQAVHEILAAFLSDNNYVAGQTVPGYSKLCVRFLDSLIRARKIVEDRNAGRPPATEGIAPLAMTFRGQQVEHGLTITGLHALWAAKQTATPKTTDEFLSIIRSFEAFVVGQFRTDLAAAVKQVYVVAYRNELTASGIVRKSRTATPFSPHAARVFKSLLLPFVFMAYRGVSDRHACASFQRRYFRSRLNSTLISI